LEKDRASFWMGFGAAMALLAMSRMRRVIDFMVVTFTICNFLEVS